MALAEARFLGYGMLVAPFALKRAVTNQREEAFSGGKYLQGLVGEPLQQTLYAPICRSQQSAVLVIGQVHPAMTGQDPEVGSHRVDQGRPQDATKHKMMPAVKTGSQHPQALGHMAGRINQGHGPALWADSYPNMRSRLNISGMAWAVKGCHAIWSAICHL